MPPKKNDKDEAEEEENPLEQQLLKEQQLNLHIDMLGDRYSRCEARCSELQEINKKLEYDLLTQKEDQVDIFTYLNTELSKRVEQVASLENQIQAMALAQEKWEKETEDEFAQIKADHERAALELNKKIADYKAELEDLQDFTKHKNALEEKLRDVENQLGQEHDSHLISLTDLERKHAQDREKIKRDYHDRLETDKGELLTKINKQLEFTTRRTIMENEMMTSELLYQNKQTEKIIKGNDRFQTDQVAMKREMELLKQAEEELVKKNQKFQKTIKLLQIKLAAHEVDHVKLSSLQDDESKLKNDELANTDEAIGQLNDKLQAMRHKLVLTQKERDKMKVDLEESRKEVKRMRELKDEAQQFLMDCLDDARKEFSVQLSEKSKEWKPDQPLPWSLRGLSKVGREALLEFLLSKMGGTHMLEKRGGRTSTMKIRSNAGSPLEPFETTERSGRASPAVRSSEADESPMLPPISPNQGGATNTPKTSLMGTWGSNQYPKQQMQRGSPAPVR